MSHPVIVHTDAISYSPIPLDDALNRATWEVRVEFTGYDDDGMERWAVRNSGRSRSRQGTWDQEPIPSSRTDKWLDAHRWNLTQAQAIARLLCHIVTWNGRTADEISERRVTS